tara:strand:+ start:7415 stop:8059 length:645 start_codon:yes stop_codon:yes gene_type:complete
MKRIKKNNQEEKNLNVVSIGERSLMLYSIAQHCYNKIKTRDSEQFTHVLQQHAKRSPEYKNKVNNYTLNEYTKLNEELLNVEPVVSIDGNMFVKVELSDQETVSFIIPSNTKLTKQLVLESIVHAIAEKASYYASSGAILPKRSAILNSKLPIFLYNIKSFTVTTNKNCFTVNNIQLETPQDVVNADDYFIHDNKDGCKTLTDNAASMNDLGFI